MNSISCFNFILKRITKLLKKQLTIKNKALFPSIILLAFSPTLCNVYTTLEGVWREPHGFLAVFSVLQIN